MSLAGDAAIFSDSLDIICLGLASWLADVTEGTWVEEDVMPLWARLSAVALAVATFFTTTAIAGDLPKEGTFSVANQTSGSYKQHTTVNNSYGGVWYETGKIVGDGILKDMAWSCFGMPEFIDGTFKNYKGYCVGTAQDGDQVVFRITVETSPVLAASSQVSAYSTEGSGKYKGIVATYKATCVSGGTPIGYTKDCNGEGSYKLP